MMDGWWRWIDDEAYAPKQRPLRSSPRQVSRRSYGRGWEPGGRRYKSWINREISRKKEEEGETKGDSDERRGEVLKATGGAAHILFVRQVSG